MSSSTPTSSAADQSAGLSVGDVRSSEWAALATGHKSRPLEWLVEKGIFLTSLSAIVMIFLIFAFVANKGWPIFAGRMNSSKVFTTIPVADMAKHSPAELQAYLGVTAAQWLAFDDETKRTLMEVKMEESKERPADKDAAVNTTAWRYILQPYQWSDYDKPVSIWQPVSNVHKYNIVPLIIGSLKATLVALLFSFPLALGAAIYVSQLASPRTKDWLKPATWLKAGSWKMNVTWSVRAFDKPLSVIFVPAVTAGNKSRPVSVSLGILNSPDILSSGNKTAVLG